MPDRDLDITKFTYFTYRHLKKSLGEFDAVVECNEIAVREFLEKANKVNSKKYIQELSAKHKVTVDQVDVFKMNARIRQYYILSVFQQFEEFLKDFKEEWLKYHIDKDWIEIKKGETNLQNVCKNANIQLSPDVNETYEYYRLVRNYMAHTSRDIKEIRKRYDKVTSNKNSYLRELNLKESPNELESINFNDFLVITNIAKHLAYVLSTKSKPSNNRIAEILIDKAKENKGRSFKGIKKLKNKPDRFEKAINSFIKTNFGRFSSKDLLQVNEKFKSLLA